MAFGLPALCVWLLDQAAKYWAVSRLAEGGLITVIPGLLQFRYATNPGAAFSLFSTHLRLLTLAAAIIAIGIVIWNYTLPPEERGMKVSLGLILGGGLGNLFDRLTRGYVVDFIDVYYGAYHWPTFNVADSATCLGIALLIVLSLRLGPSSKSPAEGVPAADSKKGNRTD